MDEVRPDLAAAPTKLTAPPSAKRSRTDFGEPIVPPTELNYLTPTSVNNRGETQTTLTSVVGTHTTTLKVSDRTAGPFEIITAIADGSPITVSWLVTGRNADSGTGAGLQPVEYAFEQKDTPSQAFHNPTRDGNTSIAQTPYAPNQQFRVHSGKPISYSASGSVFKSCVAPLDFSFPGHGHGFEHGEDQLTKSALWYAHRFYQQLELNFGGSAVMHRNTYWTYAPTGWDGASDPLEVGRACSHYLKVNYFNECRIYDLNDMSFVTLAGFTPTPGVNKFRTWMTNRDYATDDNGVQDGSIPPTITTHARSPYICALVRNTTTDFCIGVATKMSSDLRTGINSAHSKFLSGLASNFMVFSFAGAAATSIPEEPWAILVDPQGISNRRRQGWVGTTEWIFVGRFAAVTAAMAALKAGGTMDLDPDTTGMPPAAYAGTVWPPPRRASPHKNEWARYDAVFGNGTGELATHLLLNAADAGKHYIDDFGVAQYPPARIDYLPVGAGKWNGEILVCSASAEGYQNRVDISNRHLGPIKWETECPGGFRVDWIMGGIFPTGSAMQMAEAYLERINDSDPFMSNPTHMGAGLIGTPPTEPFGDPYYTGDHPPVERAGVRFDQMTSAPLFLRVRDGVYECAVRPLEFQGFGAGPNFSNAGYASQDHGALDAHPVVFYGARFFTRGTLHWRGSGVVHKTDYWGYAPTAWANDGDSKDLVVFNGTLVAVKGRFFDKAFVYDLAKGTAAGAFELVGFVAPPATNWFPSWTFTTKGASLQSDNPPFPTVRQAFPRSRYVGGVMISTTNDFAVGVAFKMQDGDETAVFGSETAENSGLMTSLTFGQFEDDDSVGDNTQAWGAFFNLQSKARNRAQGWVGWRIFTLAGRTADVLAAMDQLKRSGDLDLNPMDHLPPAIVTADTRLP